MAATSKQEYLKRYLSNNDEEKKKRKKKKPRVGAKFSKSVIVDDDVSLSDIKPAKMGEDFDVVGLDVDEAPAMYDEDGVTAISAERFQKREEDMQTKWVPVKADRDETEAGQTKRHDSDDDVSPARYRQRHDSSDMSPPRKRRSESPDMSPPRRGRRSPDTSPPRKTRNDSPDMSPPRRTRHDSPADTSPSRPKKQSKHTARSRSGNPDLSQLRRKQNRDSHGSCSDRQFMEAPPPKRRGSDSDISPPRKRAHDSSQRHDSPDQSPPWRGHHDSPGRSHMRRTRHDSDLSPPRRGGNSDSDQSPPRKLVSLPDGRKGNKNEGLPESKTVETGTSLIF